MPLQIRFTIHERDLLLSLTIIEPEIVKRLKHAMLQNSSMTINVDEDELEVLLGAIAVDAKHPKNRKLEGELNMLSHRLDEVLRIHLSA
ncbi:MAG: hypothetical protein NTV54_15795 [Ignavibacteriales bacterium]|nr:hypothetical protein [Ignavibacteriales bacterium]